MRLIKKIFISIFIFIAVMLPQAMPVATNAIIAQAATVKINYKTITLETGKTKTLRITGTKRKVTWASSKKSVATVSSKGLVTAKAVGTATITATVSGRKYTCKVTVTKPKNPYLTKAPFHAMETDLYNINFVMPSDWGVLMDMENATEDHVAAYLGPVDVSSESEIKFDITLTNDKAPDYDIAKKEFQKLYTESSINKLLSETFSEIKVTDFLQSDFKTNYVTALKTECTIPLKTPKKMIIYSFYLDIYRIDITVTDAGDADYQEITEFMLKSIIVK